jgi:hypothetical protein
VGFGSVPELQGCVREVERPVAVAIAAIAVAACSFGREGDLT